MKPSMPSEMPATRKPASAHPMLPVSRARTTPGTRRKRRIVIRLGMVTWSSPAPPPLLIRLVDVSSRRSAASQFGTETRSPPLPEVPYRLLDGRNAACPQGVGDRPSSVHGFHLLPRAETRHHVAAAAPSMPRAGQLASGCEQRGRDERPHHRTDL